MTRWYTNGTEAFTPTNLDDPDSAIMDPVDRDLVLVDKSLVFHHSAHLHLVDDRGTRRLGFYLDIRTPRRATRQEYRSLIQSLKWV